MDESTCITEHCTHIAPKPRELICCYNSLRSSGETYCQTSELGCRNLLTSSHKNISEFGHWWWAIRPGSQSRFQTPKGVGWVWGHESEQAGWVLPHQTGRTFLCGSDCTGGIVDVETGESLHQIATTNLEANILDYWPYCLHFESAHSPMCINVIYVHWKKTKTKKMLCVTVTCVKHE